MAKTNSNTTTKTKTELTGICPECEEPLTIEPIDLSEGAEVECGCGTLLVVTETAPLTFEAFDEDEDGGEDGDDEDDDDDDDDDGDGLPDDEEDDGDDDEEEEEEE